MKTGTKKGLLIGGIALAGLYFLNSGSGEAQALGGGSGSGSFAPFLATEPSSDTIYNINIPDSSDVFGNDEGIFETKKANKVGTSPSYRASVEKSLSNSGFTSFPNNSSQSKSQLGSSKSVFGSGIGSQNKVSSSSSNKKADKLRESGWTIQLPGGN